MDEAEEARAPQPQDLQSLRVRRDSPTKGSRDAFADLQRHLVEKVSEEYLCFEDESRPQLRTLAGKRLDLVLLEAGLVLNRSERRQLLEAIVAQLSEEDEPPG